MHFVFKNRLQKLGIIALIPLFQACAYAPGMHINADAIREASAPAPAITLKTITPQLLQYEKTSRANQPDQNINALIGVPGTYQIGSGDILSIVVWKHPELMSPAISGLVSTVVLPSDNSNASGFVVDQDGMVQFPLIGVQKLGGLTEIQAREQIARKLSDFIKKPDITLRIQAYRSKRIYIDGEVRVPGGQVINDIPMTLLEAMNRSGGFLPTSDQSRIGITRAGTTYNIDLPRLVEKGINPANISLVDGDMVRVFSQMESKVFVLGEVNRPATVPLLNGRLTLNEALGAAGGINIFTSDGQQIYVVRNVGEDDPIVYHLDAQSPVALALAERFELKSKDVVYVDASRLAMWSRVVGLIYPSAATAISGINATK